VLRDCQFFEGKVFCELHDQCLCELPK